METAYFFKHQTSKPYFLTSLYLHKLQPYLPKRYVYTFQLSSDTYLIYAFLLSLSLSSSLSFSAELFSVFRPISGTY